MAEARRPGRAQREPGKKARAAVRGRPAPRPGRPGARSRAGGQAGGRERKLSPGDRGREAGAEGRGVPGGAPGRTRDSGDPRRPWGAGRGRAPLARGSGARAAPGGGRGAAAAPRAPGQEPRRCAAGRGARTGLERAACEAEAAGEARGAPLRTGREAAGAGRPRLRPRAREPPRRPGHRGSAARLRRARGRGAAGGAAQVSRIRRRVLATGLQPGSGDKPRDAARRPPQASRHRALLHTGPAPLRCKHLLCGSRSRSWPGVSLGKRALGARGVPNRARLSALCAMGKRRLLQPRGRAQRLDLPAFPMRSRRHAPGDPPPPAGSESV